MCVSRENAQALAKRQQAVALELTFMWPGDDAGAVLGGFTATGSMVDAGVVRGDFRAARVVGGGRRAVKATLVLDGRHGGLTLQMLGSFGAAADGSARGSGHWVVAAANGLHAGLAGGGTWGGLENSRPSLAGIGPAVARATCIGSLRRRTAPNDATRGGEK